MTAKLTPTQIEVLTVAAKRKDRRIFPMPERVHTVFLQTRVLMSLIEKGLVDKDSAEFNADHATISDAGFEAVGMTVPTEKTLLAKADAAMDDSKKQLKASSENTPKSVRSGTKKALLIEMLQRPEGATMKELLEKLPSWLDKTIRGTISNLKSKDGIKIVSKKAADGNIFYRIS